MSLSVWRIGYSGDLTLDGLGFGSTLADGRWHSGCTGLRQVVYCGSSRSLCQLEKRVHLNGVMPRLGTLALMRLSIPARAKLMSVKDIGLPDNWRSDIGATQDIGMQWLSAQVSLGLWVPSFVEPAENNLILNPAHPGYKAVALVVEQNPFIFDPRLF